MAADVVIVGAGIGAVLVVTGVVGGPAPRPTQYSPSGGVVIPGGGSPVASPGSTVKVSQRVTMNIGRLRPPPITSGEPVVHSAQQSTNSATASDPLLQGKLNEIEASAKKAYDKLTSDAKAKGAQALNSSLNLNPPLTGNEDYEKVASVVGGAVGGAAGSYIGGPIGAKIGAVVGAYLGVKLEDLLAKNWDELSGWLDSKWNDVSGYLSSQASDLEDSAEGYADDAYNYVSGLF